MVRQHARQKKVRERWRHFFRPAVRRCPPSRATVVTDLLADMVATDLLPLSSVDGRRFRRLMEFVEYQMPHRQALTTTLEKNIKNVQKIKAELNKTRAVAI